MNAPRLNMQRGQGGRTPRPGARRAGQVHSARGCMSRRHARTSAHITREDGTCACEIGAPSIVGMRERQAAAWDQRPGGMAHSAPPAPAEKAARFPHKIYGFALTVFSIQMVWFDDPCLGWTVAVRDT